MKRKCWSRVKCASLWEVAMIMMMVYGTASAATNRPTLSITVRDGHFDNENYLNYFCPTLSSTYTKTLHKPLSADLQYGFLLAPSSTKPSCSIWCKVTKQIHKWKITTGAALASIPPQKQQGVFSNVKADIDLRVEHDQRDVSARLFASDLSISRLECTKGFDLQNTNRFIVNPRYNPQTHHADVIFGYVTTATKVKVRASAQCQEVSIAQQINTRNVIIPTIASNGDVTLRWERQLIPQRPVFGGQKEENASYIATTLKPSDSIHVEWKDGPWNAIVNIPIDGTDVHSGSNVSIRREVTF
uniref:Uncharacterized protein n=1 Tax=Ditylum brightwellii TaxID=49249 RepID=A0A7S4R771_9STRA